MQIQITVADEKVSELAEVVAKRFGYQARVKDQGGAMVDNPVSKTEFIKVALVKVLQDSLITSRAQAAQVVAASEALAAIS